MNKFWKILAIASTSVIILAIGASLALAQETPEVRPPAGPSFVDQDGDGLCDTCGREPGATYGQPGWSGSSGYPGWSGSSGQPGWAARGMRSGWGMHGSSLVAAVADALDTTVEQVVAELADGISVAQLALNHNVQPQAIVDAFLAGRAEALQEAVADGRITQEQADAMLEHMAESIAERINEPWTGGGGCANGTMGQGGRQGGGMRGGAGNAMPQRGFGSSS
jgi:hypothetical protein